MKRVARLLLGKALDSLLLSVELFNRPWDRGRTTSTLIFLDHSFEMLLKASLTEREIEIRAKKGGNTLGFDACLRRGLQSGDRRFISDEQAIALQAINNLRDSAQHYLLDISEGQLYLHMQSGVTLFRDVLNDVFHKHLSDYLPNRVLPVSTIAPPSLVALFDKETSEIAQLLAPGRRRRDEAYARLRPLAILDAAVQGKRFEMAGRGLRHTANEIREGVAWNQVFPGAASIDFVPDDTVDNVVGLRITKKEGIPVTIVPEGTVGAYPLALKRVNDLDFYSLGAKQLAAKLGLTIPKVVAVVGYLGLREKPECYKEIKIGKSKFKRYSPRALDAIKETLKRESVDEIWEKQRQKRGRE